MGFIHLSCLAHPCAIWVQDSLSHINDTNTPLPAERSLGPRPNSVHLCRLQSQTELVYVRHSRYICLKLCEKCSGYKKQYRDPVMTLKRTLKCGNVINTVVLLKQAYLAPQDFQTYYSSNKTGLEVAVSQLPLRTAKVCASHLMSGAGGL